MSYRDESDKVKAILTIVFSVGIILFFIFIGPSACVDEETTRRVLQQQGYTNIHITGFRFFGGGKGDIYRTGFEAISPSGHAVTGVVTTGWGKGTTIRFD